MGIQIIWPSPSTFWKRGDQIQLRNLNIVRLRSGDGEDEGIERSDERYSNNWASSRTDWRKMGWDEMRGLKTIDYVHIPPCSGYGWRGWDRIIRWRALKQLTKVTYTLEMDEEDGIGWSDEEYSNNRSSSQHTFWRGCNEMIRWEVLKQSTKFTHQVTTLETNEEEGIEWSN